MPFLSIFFPPPYLNGNLIFLSGHHFLCGPLEWAYFISQHPTFRSLGGKVGVLHIGECLFQVIIPSFEVHTVWVCYHFPISVPVINWTYGHSSVFTGDFSNWLFLSIPSPADFILGDFRVHMANLPITLAILFLDFLVSNDPLLHSATHSNSYTSDYPCNQQKFNLTQNSTFWLHLPLCHFSLNDFTTAVFCCCFCSLKRHLVSTLILLLSHATRTPLSSTIHLSGNVTLFTSLG